MRCPQCNRETQFPVPGLCPECYRQWKDSMRARYGPGPWPSSLPTQKSGIGQGASLGGSSRLIEDTTASIEQRVLAVLTRLQKSDSESTQLLAQVDTLLREVARMLAQVAVGRYDSEPSTR